MRKWIDLVEGQTSSELDKARALMRSGRKVLFHSGLSRDAEGIGRWGLEPTNDGPWIREIAQGAFDSDEDVASILSSTVPVVWLSDEPTWVGIKSKRSAGGQVGPATMAMVREHAHLALVDAEDYADEIFFVGPDGLHNGEYSIVTDVNGVQHRFYETPLYVFDDQHGNITPYGIEVNEWISASNLEIAANLQGEEVIEFLKEFYPEQGFRGIEG